jgi:tRNA-dihydrouridine synthase A
MGGRAAYQNPYLLAEVDRELFGATVGAPTRGDALRELIPYVEAHLSDGGRLSNVTRHVLQLYHGRPRGRAFRRLLSEAATQLSAGADVLRAAIDLAELGLHQDEQSRTA